MMRPAATGQSLVVSQKSPLDKGFHGGALLGRHHP